MVKQLLRILLGAFAVFMVLAIGQEWDFFSAAWFGTGEAEQTLEESERKAAADALYLTLSLMEHYYGSGGDPRFADRMPASVAVIEEMRADVEYLGRNRRRQEPSLERLEVSLVEALGPRRVEIRTREWWKIQVLPIEGSGLPGSGLPGASPGEPARVQKIFGKYLVVRQDRGWLVEAWDLLEPEEAAGGGDTGQ